MKVALDTNVMAYAEGTSGAAMRDQAVELIQRLPAGAVVLPVQTLGELFNVLVRKAKRRPSRARAAVLSWLCCKRKSLKLEDRERMARGLRLAWVLRDREPG